jgi:hypothetical protein
LPFIQAAQTSTLDGAYVNENVGGDHVDEHMIAVSATNPVHCTPEIRCSGHEHGPNCGHEAIPHGDHVDYLVNGRLHHTYGDQSDDHGPVLLV